MQECHLLTLKLRPSSPTGGRREGPEVALAWQLPPLLQRRRADSPCPRGGHDQRRTAAPTPAPQRCRACSRCRPRPALGPAPLGVPGHLRVTPPFRRAHTPQPLTRSPSARARSPARYLANHTPPSPRVKLRYPGLCQGAAVWKLTRLVEPRNDRVHSCSHPLSKDTLFERYKNSFTVGSS